MQAIHRYNVFDKGLLIAEEVTRGEVSKITGIPTNNLSYYVKRGNKYNGRYLIEEAGENGFEEVDEIIHEICYELEKIKKARGKRHEIVFSFNRR